MGRARKTKAKALEKCKPAARTTAAERSPFSRPWMGGFLAKASGGDLRAALAEAGLTLVDYRRARADDPTFNAACVEVDLAIRATIQQTLEMDAANGNVGAARLLARGLGALELDSDDRGPVPPHVAAAMTEAGLKAQGLATGDPHRLAIFMHCPKCNARILPRSVAEWS